MERGGIAFNNRLNGFSTHEGEPCSRHRAIDRSIASFGVPGFSSAASNASISRSVNSRMCCSRMMPPVFSAIASVISSDCVRPDSSTACSSCAARSSVSRTATLLFFGDRTSTAMMKSSSFRISYEGVNICTPIRHTIQRSIYPRDRCLVCLNLLIQAPVETFDGGHQLVEGRFLVGGVAVDDAAADVIFEHEQTGGAAAGDDR